MPFVAILMGSESDWPVMQAAAETLGKLEIDHEARITSAHRTPQATAEYVADAVQRGCAAFICGAGMAAHLAGAMAAGTPLPVIGLPMASGSLNGFDALLSTVQMPPGIPVATVAVGPAGATNAAILAAQILATGDAALARRVVEFRAAQTEKVRARDAKLSAELNG
jgi:5-(carboxyamino)imidazole ribonucleotide mutase